MFYFLKKRLIAFTVFSALVFCCFSLQASECNETLMSSIMRVESSEYPNLWTVITALAPDSKRIYHPCSAKVFKPMSRTFFNPFHSTEKTFYDRKIPKKGLVGYKFKYNTNPKGAKKLYKKSIFWCDWER